MSPERDDYIYVAFRPGDVVKCTRHYEKEKAYLPNKDCPKFGKTYIVSEITIGYNGEVWLGLYGVGSGVAGWSAKNFEAKLKKGKKETVPVGRMIRI